MNRSKLPPMASLVIALASCSSDPAPTVNGPNGYILRGVSPYPEQILVGASVRNLILRLENRADPAMHDDQYRCGYSFVTFDVSQVSTLTFTAISTTGDCKLYMTPPESAYEAQRWVCAGGIEVDSGSLMQNATFCPPAGAMAPWDRNFGSCGAFVSDRSATVSSGDEGVPGDTVTDLAGTVRFPQTPVITQPSALPVITWPGAGDLTVAWSSAGATDAVVRIEPDTAARTGPTIICSPRINGTMRIDAALIDRGGFRAMNGRLRVWSYREVTVQAEGHAWNLAGAAGTSLLLQPGR